MHSGVADCPIGAKLRRHMNRAVLLLGLLGISALPLAVACSASGKNSGFDGEDAGTVPPVDPGSSGGLGGDAGIDGTAPSGAPLLYAHTDTTLYQLDPQDIGGAVTTVGDFDCVGKTGPAKTMTDLAVTKDGKLFGVSEGAAFPLTIQGSTVHCEATWTLPATRFYGLTVAPENTLGAAEVLIGADGEGGLYQIDATSGTPTQVGTLGTDPKTKLPWALSGDIVFVANSGNPIGFATVRTCPTNKPCATTDTLIEVDVKLIKPGKQSVMKSVRGDINRGSWCKNAASPASFGSLFGIVAYKDAVYGFSRAGDIVEIHNADGSACLISSDTSRKYAGAGVTTIAPVIAPVN
jgi:hypothetical protein